MKRLLVCVFLLIPVALFAQVSPNVNVPANGVASTVIPVSSSYQNGNVVRVTNGSTSTDCTTGGGTNAVLCYWTGSAWAPASGSGTGSVTSFSANALSPLFTTSTATPTTTPALSFSLNTQSANVVFAGPSSGSASAPTFRALTAGDIPALSYQAPLSTYAAPANEFLTGFTSPNTFTAAQPGFSNLSGTASLGQLPTTLAQFTGTITAGDCAKWSSSGVLADQGAACGAGGGFTAGGDLSGTSTSQTVIGLQGKSLAAPTTASTFPEYNGTSIVWATGTGTTTPGGANTQIQFNNSGAFGGSANFTWNNTNQALAENGTMTVAGLVNPAGPTLSTFGTAGTTSYSYAVVAEQGSATTAEGAVATINTGNATLSATNYNIVTTPSVAGATACDVYRTASGGSPSTTGKIGTVSCGSALNDTGLTASGSAPTSNGTGTITAANFVTSGPGAGFTQWTDSALSPGAAGTVLCGANSNSYFACSFNGGAVTLMPALANDLGGTDPTNPQVVGFHLTSEGETGDSPVTFSLANDTTTGTTQYKLAKIVNESGTQFAIAAGTADASIPVYITASATAISGNARLVTAGSVGTCTFDAAATVGDYVEASTTTAGECHDAGASAPSSGFVVGQVYSAASGAGVNALVKTLGYNSAAGGSSVWSGLTSATANLTLSNSTYNTTFNQTTGSAAWLWANTTAATSTVAQPSPQFCLAGNNWTGSGASTVDEWCIQDQPANGLNNADTLNFAHTTSSTSGYASQIAFPGITLAGVPDSKVLVEATISDPLVLASSGASQYVALAPNGVLDFEVQTTGSITLENTGATVQTGAANSNISGTIAVSSATSASHSFTASAYTAAPVCTLTPTSNPGALTWWVTTSTTAVTANLSASGTVTFNYICVGNPN